jgi:tetratricopeptide (TPR) repeat protein
MSHDDRLTRGGCSQRPPPMLLIGLGAIVILLAGCAAPPAKPSAEVTQTTGANDSNLEQRLRDLQQAEALYLSGRYKDAQAAFEQLARMYPNIAEVWFRLGNTLMKQGQYDNAAAALQTAIGLDPGNGRAALNLALCRLAQAQAAMDVARGRLAAGTPERRQAEGIHRQLTAILSDSTHSDSSQ